MEPTIFQAELELDAQAGLGEGPHWDGSSKCLYWVDIDNGELHRYDPATRRDDAIPIGHQVSAVVPCRSGGLLLATRQGICVFDSHTGIRRTIGHPESHLPGNRFNDGKCDASGRFWAGTMDVSGTAGAGSLYRIDTEGRIDRMVQGITCSNGIAWSLDGSTLYYIDTPTRQVVAYDYDMRQGSISGPRMAVDMAGEPGMPDGMTIDAEGMLWVAQWGGWQAARYDPATGAKLAQVQVPAAKVTSCAFGGDNLDILYITTARTGLNARQLEDQPLAGGLFKVVPGVAGLPACVYGG